MTQAEVVARLSDRPYMTKRCISVLPLYNDGGAAYLSSITEGSERIGIVHVYIWDKEAKGKPEVGKMAARRFLTDHRLDRLACEIDADNDLAIGFARKVGFHDVGILRRLKDDTGRKRDVLLMDAMPEDLYGRR